MKRCGSPRRAKWPGGSKQERPASCSLSREGRESAAFAGGRATGNVDEGGSRAPVHEVGRVIRLAECTSRRAARLARNDASVVLLPVGAIEQHGPHLPLFVDWLGAEELARRLAPHLRRAGFLPVLAPSLPYGVSPMAADWSGKISLTEKTFLRLVLEILGALANHGFCRFVLVNYQADPGHLRALASVKTDLERRGTLQVLFAGFAPGSSGRLMFHPKVKAL